MQISSGGIGKRIHFVSLHCSKIKTSKKSGNISTWVPTYGYPKLIPAAKHWTIWPKRWQKSHECSLMNVWIQASSLSHGLQPSIKSMVSSYSKCVVLEADHCLDLLQAFIEGNDTGRLRLGNTFDFRAFSPFAPQTKSSSEKWLLHMRVFRDTFLTTLQDETHFCCSSGFLGKKWRVIPWDSSFWQVCTMQLRRPFLRTDSGRFNTGTAPDLIRLYLPETDTWTSVSRKWR